MNPNQNQVQTSQAQQTPQQPAVPAVWQRFAEVLGASPGEAKAIVASTIMPNAKPAEVLAFVAVAAEHQLNPLLKQIYAFPTKGGGISPMISIDGWIAMVQRHPDCDGFEFTYEDRNDKAFSVTCTMRRKGWANPVIATEYLEECARNTEPWTKSPRRMLRHRAFIQAARLAFGFGGLIDEEELGEPSGQSKPLPPREAEFEELTRAMEKPAAEPQAKVEPAATATATPQAQPRATEQPAAAQAQGEDLCHQDTYEDPA